MKILKKSNDFKKGWVFKNNVLASESRDNTIKLWGGTKSELIRKLTGHDDYVNSLAVDNKNLLVSGSADNTIILWSTTTGESIRNLTAYSDGIHSVDFDKTNVLARARVTRKSTYR